MSVLGLILSAVFVLYFVAGFVFFLTFAISSRREKEARAERRAWQFAGFILANSPGRK